ncbi:unnamed protein product [Calypogeia fissa]
MKVSSYEDTRRGDERKPETTHRSVVNYECRESLLQGLVDGVLIHQFGCEDEGDSSSTVWWLWYLEASNLDKILASHQIRVWT